MRITGIANGTSMACTALNATYSDLTYLGKTGFFPGPIWDGGDHDCGARYRQSVANVPSNVDCSLVDGFIYFEAVYVNPAPDPYAPCATGFQVRLVDDIANTIFNAILVIPNTAGCTYLDTERELTVTPNSFCCDLTDIHVYLKRVA